jgi:hypothetical protein
MKYVNCDATASAVISPVPSRHQWLTVALCLALCLADNTTPLALGWQRLDQLLPGAVPVESRAVGTVRQAAAADQYEWDTASWQRLWCCNSCLAWSESARTLTRACASCDPSGAPAGL